MAKHFNIIRFNVEIIIHCFQEVNIVRELRLNIRSYFLDSLFKTP